MRRWRHGASLIAWAEARPFVAASYFGQAWRWGFGEVTVRVGSKHEAGSVHGDEGGSSLVQVRGGVGNGGLVSMTPQASRMVGRANSSYSESNSTQSTPTKSVSKPPSSGFRSRGVDGSVGGGARARNFAALYKGMPISCCPATVVNSVEVPYFDLKEDPSFWMEHNVQVLIRVRPFNSMERTTQGYNRCVKQESAQSIT